MIFYLSTSMYQIQVCIYNSFLDFDGSAYLEIFRLGLEVSSYINSPAAWELPAYTYTQFLVTQILFHKI